MQRRHGVSRADVIVVTIIIAVGLAIFIPAIKYARGIGHRSSILRNMDAPMGFEGAGYFRELESTVVISAPEKDVPSGLYHASIPIPDNGNPLITGGVLKEALNNRIRQWARSNNVRVIAATYDTNPEVTELYIHFSVVR